MIRRWLVPVLIWLVVGGLAWAMLWPAQQAVHGPAFTTDFHKFLLSVERFAVHGGLYAPPQSDEAAALLHGNLNPPPFSLPMLGLAWLGFADALALWQWLSLAGLLLAVPLLWRLAEPQPRPTGALFMLALGLAAGAGYPALVVYNIGQVTFLLLPVLLLALVAILRGYSLSGGAVLGLLCLLKPMFGLLVLLLLLRGAWRAVAGAVAGGAAMTLVGALVFGTAAYGDYVVVLGSVDWHGVSWNASLLGLFDRLLGGAGGPSPLAYLLHVLCAVVLIAALMFAARGMTREAGLRLTLAGGLPLLLLLSPLGWMYYWAWCVPAAALLAPVLRAAGRSGFAWWLLVPALGSLRVTPLAPFPPDAESLAAFGAWSFYLLVIAALFALVLAAGRVAVAPAANRRDDHLVTSV